LCRARVGPGFTSPRIRDRGIRGIALSPKTRYRKRSRLLLSNLSQVLVVFRPELRGPHDHCFAQPEARLDYRRSHALRPGTELNAAFKLPARKMSPRGTGKSSPTISLPPQALDFAVWGAPSNFTASYSDFNQTALATYAGISGQGSVKFIAEEGLPGDRLAAVKQLERIRTAFF